MELVFIDEFGCNREYHRHILKDAAFHPTRGYGGAIIPAENLKGFAEDFAVLKVMALRQYKSMLQGSKASIVKLGGLCPEVLDKKKSPEVVRDIISRHDDADRIFSALVSAEIKSSELFKVSDRSIASRRRFIQLFLSTIERNGGSIFFSGYEKRTINLPAKLKGNHNAITLKEVEHSTDVLRKYAIARNARLKLLFDQHSIDDMNRTPLLRKRHFDKYIISNNLGRFFPETATVDVDSKYSLCMQAADWSCGLIARFLALNLEPKERARFDVFFPVKTRNLWASVTSPHSHIRHGRGDKFFSKIITQAAQTEMQFD